MLARSGDYHRHSQLTAASPLPFSKEMASRNAFAWCVLLVLLATLPYVAAGDSDDDDDEDMGIGECIAHIMMIAHFTYENPAMGIVSIVIGFMWACTVHRCCEPHERRNFFPSKKTRYATLGVYAGSQLCNCKT